MTTENTVETVEMVEISAKELAELRKKLEQFENSYKYFSRLHDEKETELRRVHEILDNLPRSAPRSEPKTEENQWPIPYTVATRLAIWLGSR